MYPYNYEQTILPGGGYHCVSDILVKCVNALNCTIEIVVPNKILTSFKTCSGGHCCQADYLFGVIVFGNCFWKLFYKLKVDFFKEVASIC